MDGVIPIVMTKRPGPLAEPLREFLRAEGQPVVLHEAERLMGLHPEAEKNRCLNIARGRTEAFRRALREWPAARFFFSLDADLVPEVGAVGRLRAALEGLDADAPLRSRLCVGGWFEGKLGGWIGGRYREAGPERLLWRECEFGKVRNGSFAHFTAWQPGLTETDLLSLGCTLVPRELVAGVEFEAGIDRYVRLVNGRMVHLADSGAFSARVQTSGGRLFLCGDVVARHLAARENFGGSERIPGKKQMKLTNQQVENAVNALTQFNPACNLKTKLRLSRNLRKLVQALQDKEHDKQRLLCAAVRDKARLQTANGSVPLNAEEMQQFQKEHEQLMQEAVEVELQPIALYDSKVEPHEKGPKDLTHAIDVSEVAVPNSVLMALVDVVFVEE